MELESPKTPRTHDINAPSQPSATMLGVTEATIRYAQELLIPYGQGARERLMASDERQGALVFPDGSHLDLGAIAQPFLSSDHFGKVSVKNFSIAYLTAHDQAIYDAKHLIAQHRSTSALTELRAGLYTQTSHQLIVPSHPPSNRGDIDTLSHERIFAAALDPHSPQQRIYSADMAILALGLAERRQQLTEKYSSRKDVVHEHVGHVRQAFEVGMSYSEPEERFLRTFESLYKLKAKRFGTPPKLITVHDIDKTISPVETYNRDKPGHAIDRLCYRVFDSVRPGIPGPQRCPLAHHLLGDPEYCDRASQFYRKTAESIKDFMYHDMERGIREASELGVEIHFLTGNLQPLADGVASVLGIQPRSALGVRHNDSRSSAKPFELFSLLLDNPNSIIVMIDDSDGSLLRGLTKNSILDCQDMPVFLKDSVLFIARGPDSLSGRAHALADHLSVVATPHGLNYYAESQSSPTGYQGFNQLVSAYVALRS